MGDLKTNKLRSSTILDMYYDYTSKNGFVSPKTFAEWLQTQPAPRFYVEYETARRFVSLILRDKCPKCRKVYYDLAERFRELYGTKLDFTPLLDMIEEPAPSFYLSVDRIVGILYSEMRSRLKIKK